MKGISLPINVIVIIAVTVLVLVSVALFFSTQAVSGMTSTEAQGTFDRGCVSYCSGSSDGFDTAANICGRQHIGLESNTASDKFLKACQTLGYVSQIEASEFCYKCLESCANDCNLDTSPEQITQDIENIVNSLDDSFQ